MPAEAAAVAGASRQVAIARLSFQEELANVIRASASIVVLVWIYLAATLGDGRDLKRTLLPYQALIQNRPTAEQRMFRELQEGLLEAETMRSAEGAWPSPELLAEQGIPPFAPDPTVRGARYRWSLLKTGNTINYLGLPDRDGAPSWVVVIQEPQPGVPPDQLFEDEEHHKLLDGTMLHVATWSHAAGRRTPERLTTVPQAEGWEQLYAVGPSALPVAIMPQ